MAHYLVHIHCAHTLRTYIAHIAMAPVHDIDTLAENIVSGTLADSTASVHVYCLLELNMLCDALGQQSLALVDKVFSPVDDSLQLLAEREAEQRSMQQATRSAQEHTARIAAYGATTVPEVRCRMPR